MDNQATIGGGIGIATGGSALVYNSTVSFRYLILQVFYINFHFDCVNISRNIATNHGGGMNVNSPQYFEMEKSEVSHNYGGGAIFHNDTTIVFFSIH